MREYEKVWVNVLVGLSIFLIPSGIITFFFEKIHRIPAIVIVIIGVSFWMLAVISAYIFEEKGGKNT